MAIMGDKVYLQMYKQLHNIDQHNAIFMKQTNEHKLKYGTSLFSVLLLSINEIHSC